MYIISVNYTLSYIQTLLVKKQNTIEKTKTLQQYWILITIKTTFDFNFDLYHAVTQHGNTYKKCCQLKGFSFFHLKNSKKNLK